MKKAEICKSFLKETYRFFKEEYKEMSSPWRPYYNKKDIKKETKFIIDFELPSYFNWKSSEWALQKKRINGKMFMFVSVLGSNDVWDWIFWNPNIFSWNGYKLSGLYEARRVMKVLNKINTFNIPLIIGTHSKSGCSGWPLYEICKKAGIEIDSIHAFAPAKGLRKKMSIPEATMYIDKSDPVPKLGLTLNHPDCKIVYHPEKDGIGIDTSDHGLDHWDSVL